MFFSDTPSQTSSPYSAVLDSEHSSGTYDIWLVQYMLCLVYGRYAGKQGVVK